MKKKKSLQRLISELDDWIGRPRNREIILDGSRKSLEQYIEGTLKTPIAALSGVASWLGQSGAHRVLHGDPSGWDEIGRSLQYMAWDERTLFAMLRKGTAKSIRVIRSIFVLLHAISTGQDEIGTWFGTRLISAFQKNDERLTGWNVPLYPFALHLFAKWKRLPFDYSPTDSCELGVYQDLLDSWDDGADFAKRVSAACDYHVDQAFDDSSQDTQDFFYTLYNLFPVEVLAVKRIRELHGETMPEIDHPLMKTSLGKLLERMPSPQDDMLQEVSLKVCNEFEISNPWNVGEV